jgi:hypothetical protein
MVGSSLQSWSNSPSEGQAHWHFVGDDTQLEVDEADEGPVEVDEADEGPVESVPRMSQADYKRKVAKIRGVSGLCDG